MAQQMLSMVAAAAAQSSSPCQTQQQQHATPRIKVKGRRRVKRTSYSLSLKLRAVEEAERSGLRAAAVSLQLDERVLRQWVTKAEELRQAGLTNAGSTRRLRSRSASMSKQPVAGSSPDDEVQQPSPPPPTHPTDNVTEHRSVSLLAVTPPAGLVINGVHNLNSISSPSVDGSPCSHSTSCSSSLVVSRADACVGTCTATMTEPEFFGPCEPGTAVTLDGVIWHENEGGILVVNVTWRGKTYVGTLMDSTKNDWAPPRFFDSPSSDGEYRGPKGRPRRTRGASSTPVQTNGGGIGFGGAKGRRSVGGFPALPSPAKDTMASHSSCKRKGNTNCKNSDDVSINKRSRSSSRGGCSSSPKSIEQPVSSSAASPVLIECPEPNCSKKFRHINGLKYHQSHAHEAQAEESIESACIYNENSISSLPIIIKNDTAQLAILQLEEFATPFTGKVPMPPPPEGSITPVNLAKNGTVTGASPQKPPKPNSLPLPVPSPVFLPSSSSTPSSIPTDVAIYHNESNKPTVEHLLTPILAQSTTSPSTPLWIMMKLSNPTAEIGTSIVTESDIEPIGRKDRSKHKKKNKIKDRGKEDSSSKKTPRAPIMVTNEPFCHSKTPMVMHSSILTSSAINEDLPAVSLISDAVIGVISTNHQAIESNRDNIQSPAYSDISDANDQCSSLLDVELENKKIEGKMAAESTTCLPSATGSVGSGVHSALGSFNMYPFYSQPTYTHPSSDQSSTKFVVKSEKGNVDSIIKPETTLQSPLPSAPMTTSVCQPQPYGIASPFPIDPSIANPTACVITNKMPDQGFASSSPLCKEEKKTSIDTSVTPVQKKSDPIFPSTVAIQNDLIQKEIKKAGKAVADKTLAPSCPLPHGSEFVAFDSTIIHQQQQHPEELQRLCRVYSGEAMFGPTPAQASMGRFPSPMNSPGDGGSGQGWVVNGVKSSPHDPQQQVQLHMQQQQQMHQHQQFQQQFQQQLQQQLKQQQQQQLQQQQLQQQHFQQQRRSSIPSKSSSSMHISTTSPKLRPLGIDRKQDEQQKACDGVKPVMETHGAGTSPYGMFPNIHLYGLPFDSLHPAYRNMATMMGGAPYPFSPSPSAGVSPVDMPHQMSPGMRGFPGPSGDDLSRAHALEMLQHHASQYYATTGPQLSSNQGLCNSTGTSQQFQSQRLVHDLTMERAMKQPVSPAVGLDKLTPMGHGGAPPNH